MEGERGFGSNNIYIWRLHSARVWELKLFISGKIKKTSLVAPHAGARVKPSAVLEDRLRLVTCTGARVKSQYIKCVQRSHSARVRELKPKTSVGAGCAVWLHSARVQELKMEKAENDTYEKNVALCASVGVKTRLSGVDHCI